MSFIFWQRVVAVVLLAVGLTWAWRLRRRRKLEAQGAAPPSAPPEPVPQAAPPAPLPVPLSIEFKPDAKSEVGSPSEPSVSYKTLGAVKAPTGATIYPAWDRHRKTQEERLPLVEPGDVPTADTSDYAFGPLTPVLAAMLPESEARRETLKVELRHAGYYQPHAMQNIAAVRYVAIVLPLLLMGALMILAPQRLEPLAVGGLIALPIMGWALPRLYVRGKGADRKSEIERSLPDVLDMLNMCVSQGMTLLVALQRVNRELRSVYPALSEELQIVAEQAKIGTLEHALQNFQQRVDVPDVHSFATLLIQTERMGTSVSVALADYAKNMRESLRQRADEKANKATFKLLFPTVLCLMPAVYMFLLGPAVVELSDFFNGGNRVINESTRSIQRYNRR